MRARRRRASNGAQYDRASRGARHDRVSRGAQHDGASRGTRGARATGGVRRGRLAAVLALGGALALAGCATPADPGGAPPSSDATTPSPDPDAPVTDDDSPGPSPTPSDPAVPLGADLTITLDETGEGETRTWRLTCEPVGGDHPDPDAACDALARGGLEAFAPTPRDVACTEQWGGPQRATVTGTVDGTRVDAEFSRINGCEISRWEALAPLLGSSGGLL